MRVIQTRNVNGAYEEGLWLLDREGEPAASRAGNVKVAPWPVMTVYDQPQERVLFDATRDANPFFHLMEGLWMLAGRDDAAFLNHYVADFGKRFAEHGDEPGAYVHGAYGHRWRHSLGFDQLNVVVERLQKNTLDRQCVLQMWDTQPEHVVEQSRGSVGDRADGSDIWTGHDDLRGDWKDRPCNTHIYLRIREKRDLEYVSEVATYSMLDMTVLCRSNDIVWGAYGSNAVHFSMLQEYLAGRIGVGIGKMYQFSNNYHGYVEILDKLGNPYGMVQDPYDNAEVYSMTMGTDWGHWDEDLGIFMRWHDQLWGGAVLPTIQPPNFTNQWFEVVAVNAAMANYFRVRYGDLSGALHWSNNIAAPDWHTACCDWLNRRIERRKRTPDVRAK